MQIVPQVRACVRACVCVCVCIFCIIMLEHLSIYTFFIFYFFDSIFHLDVQYVCMLVQRFTNFHYYYYYYITHLHPNRLLVFCLFAGVRVGVHHFRLHLHLLLLR